MKLLLLFGMATLAWGQAEVSSGDLRGIVTDPDGSAVPTAKVTANDVEHGILRAAAADTAGEYRIGLLPPGVYRVRVEAPGFAARVVDGVEIRVGETRVLNARLEVGALTSEVTVAAEAPVIEAERTQQASTLDARRINELPINRRNYLDFALLTPGVTQTVDMVDAQDYRVAQTPQSGLSFGGGNGRGNAFTVDGTEAYASSGGVRPTVSQEAVLEFQVNRNSFTAEVSDSQGGAINIITKSGTNQVHGDLFGFVRDRALDARNYFDPTKSAYTRQQSGITLGGPLRHDRTFLFAAYERLDSHETAFVPILEDRSSLSQLTPQQQQLVNFFESNSNPLLQQLAAGINQKLITTNYPATLALLNANSGAFPFSEGDNQFSVRLDHQFSLADTFFVRGNIGTLDTQNTQFGALIGYSRGRTFKANDASVMMSNTRILSPRWLSETRFMFDHDMLHVIPNDPYGPSIDIDGFGSFGRDLTLPSMSSEHHYQFQQNFNYTTGVHSIKFGVDINPVSVMSHSETFFGGRFLFGPEIPLSGLINVASGIPNASTLLTTLFKASGHPELIADLNSPLSAVQDFNLGLPLLYQQGFGNPNWSAWFKNFGFFLQDSWKVRRNLTLNLGVRYDLEAEPDDINTDTNNVAPRIGFAWTPGDGKTVIRGGGGLFYGQINAQIADIPATLNGLNIAQVGVTALGTPGLIYPATGQPLTSFNVYQTLLAQGVIGTRTITEQDIAQFGLLPGPNAYGRIIFGISKDYVNPFSGQGSLEIEHAFGNWAVSAGYEFNRGMRLPRSLDENLYYTGRTADNVPTYGFYNPAILQDNVLQSTAASSYNALIVQVQKRFSRHFALNAHYTFSKAMDYVTDFNSDYQPNDQLNARAEWALSAFNQKHRVVGTAIFESPRRAGKGQGLANNLLGNWTVAPIIQAHSGQPFNILVGYDNVGDNHDTTHRPFGAGRNIGLGPDFFGADMRLARRFPFGAEGRRNVEFTAEGFNLLNRTNFKNVNNTVGDVTLQQLPNPIVGQRGDPTAPLSFTSAYDPRQIQLGLKVNF